MEKEDAGKDPLCDLWREFSLMENREENSFNDAMIKGSRLADCTRSQLVVLQFAKKSQRITECCFNNLADDYMKKYSEIVDNFEGLNNYADEAVELAKRKGYTNESKKWVSALQCTPVEDFCQALLGKVKPEKNPLENEVEALISSFNSTQVSKIESSQPFGGQYQSAASEPRKPGYSSNLNVFKDNPSTVMKGHGVISGYDQPVGHKASQHMSKYVANTKTGFPNSRQEENIQKRKYPTEQPKKTDSSTFKTAKEKLISDDLQKQGIKSGAYGSGRKCLGSRRTVTSSFVPPIANRSAEGKQTKTHEEEDVTGHTDERLKNIDPKMIELMNNEIMDHGPPVAWADIAGLEFAKKTIQEIVVWPLLRPDLFTGLRGPPKGILLFGPPGTGKTLIGKCIASQSKSTFFCISASSLTSKWVGEGEKLVRALFAVARCHQPAVIFIDEIDSLLTHRSDNEHESSRRIKTEFLVQLDGASTATDERLLIVGATNRPHELDEAARRRLVKRLYIPLPEAAARKEIVEKLVKDQSHSLTGDQLEVICKHTEGYSGADMANLCKEAALGPMRDLNFADIEHIMLDQVRAINLQDFLKALKQVRASVSDKDLQMYEDWNNKFGSANF